MPNLFGVEVSDHTYELNKHMLEQPKEPKTDARKDLDAELRQQFARNFEAQWRLLDGPPLQKEFYFCPDRQWRSDYLVIGTKVLIELEGGVFSGGRHIRAKGFVNDAFKYNQACILGYRLIRLATGMVTAHYLQQIIDAIKGVDCGESD